MILLSYTIMNTFIIKYYLRYIIINILPQKLFFKLSHFKLHNQYGNHTYWVNLKNPKTFNEKIIWLKSNFRSTLGTRIADKILVKDYVSKKIGKDFLIPSLAVYTSLNEINPNDLPDKCVIKPNHSSGWIFFFDKNKDLQNWSQIHKKLKTWLSVNSFYHLNEWQYKNIYRKILVEPYIDNLENVIDYKFYCFNGEPKYIQIDLDRHKTHKRAFVDLNWNLTDIALKYPKTTNIPMKPKNLERMIEIARILSADFVFSRIDLYNVKGKILFGEITLHPEAGNGPFENYDQDLLFGNHLKLPIEESK